MCKTWYEALSEAYASRIVWSAPTTLLIIKSVSMMAQLQLLYDLKEQIEPAAFTLREKAFVDGFKRDLSATSRRHAARVGPVPPRLH